MYGKHIRGINPYHSCQTEAPYVNDLEIIYFLREENFGVDFLL